MKIHIKNARVEVDNAKRNVEIPTEEFGIEDLNPRGQIAKQMEMGARRSIALHKVLMALLDIQGSLSEVKYRPAAFGDPEVQREMKVALGDSWWHEPTWKYGWEYLVDLWSSGGIRRGLDVALVNMPTVNRERVQKMMWESDMLMADEIQEFVRKEQINRHGDHS